MRGHKNFFEGRVKTEKGTLSEGATEKDTRIGFVIEFMGRIGKQPGKTQAIEDIEFRRVRSFVE